MTTEAPDPRNFKSWEDAFQYPVPVVRKLESQLRSSAGDNREKLRSLVGASYRSLLDTAETIIDMEVRMEHVESKLSRVGQNCNSRGLDRVTTNANKMDTHNRGRDLERYSFASQLSVLRNCPIVMMRLMKSDGSYLLIAKVLVISRLLHKALSQSTSKPPIVDQLRDRIGSVRRKLLRRIDRRLATTTGDLTALVESMCAYSLATSSTPTDVLRHFHLVRMEEVGNFLENTDALAENGIKALKLCIQTCLDTQSIFPRRLAESLAKLKVQPLVQDADVRALYELNLDVYYRWIGDEARNYTPWPRHDELQKTEAEKILHQWSKQSITTFLKGIKASLDQEQRLSEVASLRSDLIETWILSGSRMAGIKSANVLDDLRDTMNNQLENIVRARSQNLQQVVIELSKVLESGFSHNEEQGLSLWNIASTPMDLSNGAQAFKSAVLNIYQGRNEAVIKVASAFDHWMESVLEVKGIVKSMKEARWDDTFADDVDDLDDEFGDSKQTLLNDDDPRLLEDATQDALADALDSLGKSVGQIVARLNSGKEEDTVPRSVFVLRIVREIGDRIPKLRLQERSTPPPSPFKPGLLKPLHAVLATHIIRPALDSYQKSLVAGTKSKSRSYILWEGQPPLPAQPSPSTFRFLQDLVKSMGSQGSDLWAPSGVSILKSMVCDEIAAIFKAHLEAVKKSDMEQEKEVDPAADATTGGEEQQSEGKKDGPLPTSEEARGQRLKQALFDVLYVERFVGTSNTDGAINDLVENLDKDTGLDDVLMGRLKKNASDYWRKTYLMFALLA
ncbi:hypothetical protein BS50DRAFT_506710 [Corynespora cassiicola Philippines]|uniref:Conserved oligomeric Golgi complex subunit 1 n=1 Tax=Corynespora cassiicola Philippines TaxID=1448308 RepID=A0A2T2N4F4_CORCC|nr:hypothetical protein BS50DRAFT_506710 [Corynespora cassiicola Philippines]